MSYIAIEGIDTSGKSTQISLLKDIYKDAIFTKEPFCEEIRNIVLHKTMSERAKFLLFLADRAEHIEAVIKTSMDSLIISDRSLISGIAYYAGDSAVELNYFATDRILPKKAVLLWLTKAELQDRLGKKTLDTIEAKGVDYLLSLQEKLEDSCLKCEIPYIKIDARLKPQEILQKIIAFIDLR